jgi:hypothetical protein
MHPLYRDVCAVLSSADKRKGTIKRLCLAPNIRNKKATLALASETARFVPTLVVYACTTRMLQNGGLIRIKFS